MKKNNWLLFMCILSIVIAAIAYFYMPDQIPTHWNINGDINSYGSKATIFIISALPLSMYLLFMVIPKIDPKKENYNKYADSYNMTRTILVAFMCILNIIIIVATFKKINIGFFVPFLVGILFIVLGNYMPRFKTNYFCGIKTPWTLSNDMVWNKTHKLGGYYFCILGLLFIIWSVFQFKLLMVITVVFLALGIIYLYVYSYLLFQKINNKK